jgi:hypothetical protein
MHCCALKNKNKYWPKKSFFKKCIKSYVSQQDRTLSALQVDTGNLTRPSWLHVHGNNDTNFCIANGVPKLYFAKSFLPIGAVMLQDYLRSRYYFRPYWYGRIVPQQMNTFLT